MSTGTRVKVGMYGAYRYVSSIIRHIGFTIGKVMLGLVTSGTYHMKGTKVFGLLEICSVSINFPANRVCGTKLSYPRNTGSVLGMDTHADVSCAGKDAYILETLEGRLCEVRGFHDSYNSLTNVEYVNVAYKYLDKTGQEYLLEVNQALNFTNSMTNSILCTNQARHNGVIVNDIPQVIDKQSPQCITFPSEDINLPLVMKGPVPVIPVMRPTEIELQTLPRLQLTSDNILWNPNEIFGSLDDEPGSAWYDDDPTYHMVSGLKTLGNIASRDKVISSISGSVRPNKCDARYLSKLWGIGLKAAQRTIDSTTQTSIRMSNELGLSKRVRTKVHQRRYRQLDGHLGRFSSDTFFSNCRSLRGNQCFQLFTNKAAYTKTYCMESKSDAHFALNRFVHEVGVPTELHTDGSKEQALGRWKQICQKHAIYRTWTEPHSPWQNLAEKAGGIIKARCRDMMRRSNTPIVLWDYCIEYNSELRSVTAAKNIELEGRTPFEKVMGYTPDISELVEFNWYDWVWYYDPTKPERVQIGRWLGPAHNAGQGLAYYVLNENAEVVMRSSVTTLKESEVGSQEIQERQKTFTNNIEEKIGNHTKSVTNRMDQKPEGDADIYHTVFFGVDDHSEDMIIQELDDSDFPVSMPYHDEYPNIDAPCAELQDNLVGAEVNIPTEGGTMIGRVKRRKRDSDTNMLVGSSHKNPILDSRVYEVEFQDGTYTDYSANVLIENIMNSADDNGHTPMFMDEIVGHRYDQDAISKDDGWYITPQGARKRKITTRGCDINVSWKDGTTSWVPLKDMKESNPLEVAEYASRNNLIDHPVFAWWVPITLKRRARIIKQVTHRLAKKQIKFGVKVPNSVDEALSLDKENQNSLWADAINKELKNVLVAFKLLEEGEHLPVGSKLIPYHIIFDVKLDLTRKARLVAGGHRNKSVPSYTTFSTVASRDSVRIIFTVAALNGLDIMSADVGNAYLNAICREKVHVKCGKELFGIEHEGKYAVISRALYGLKTSGASWRHHLAAEIRELGFVSTKADVDVYRRESVKGDMTAYYEYLVVYVDDIICVSEDPSKWMKILGTRYRLRDVGVPIRFLGSDIKRKQYIDENGYQAYCWAFGSDTYVKDACNLAESQMKKHGITYPSTRRHGSSSPFSSQMYRPELDSTEFCNENLTTMYQNLVGVLRWIIELGRIDIHLETSLLSQYLAQPRLGHLKQACNIFRYLKRVNSAYVVMDPTKWDIEWTGDKGEAHPKQRAQYMKELYPDARDNMPHDMPKPLGNSVNISCFVDADHAGNKLTRRSHTGVIIFLNSAPILWYSKRQNTVESSTFGSELVAMKQAMDMIEGLIYKLRMFGIPVEGEARIMCDNMAAVKSGSNPDARLQKKHNSIAFHRIREAVAAGWALIYHEKGDSNLADLLTKVLSVEKRRHLIIGLLG